MIFKEAVGVIKLSYERFIGTGFYFGLFLLLLIYIIFRNKNENEYIKPFFSLYPFFIIVIIFNPIFYYVVTKFIDVDVYWRSFWCLPLGIVIAYGFTKIIKDIKKEKIRKLEFIVIIFAIFLSGKFIYTSEFFSKVDNYYKVPDLALEMILEISNDNEENKKVAGTEEIMVYMRQIDGTVETEDYRSVGEYSEELIISKIEKGQVSIYAQSCIESGCNYIVTENNVETDANIEDYGYIPIKTNEKYTLYKLEKKEINNEEDLSWKK